METLIKLSEFFGGLILFLIIGWFIGHLLKLEEWSEYSEKNEFTNSKKEKNIKY